MPHFALDTAVVVIDGTRWSATCALPCRHGFLGKERGINGDKEYSRTYSVAADLLALPEPVSTFMLLEELAGSSCDSKMFN